MTDKDKPGAEGSEGSEGLPQSGRIGIYLRLLRYLLLEKDDSAQPMLYLFQLSEESWAGAHGCFSSQSFWKAGSARLEIYLWNRRVTSAADVADAFLP